MMNHVAVLSNLDQDVSDIAAYFEANLCGMYSSAIRYIFIASE